MRNCQNTIKETYQNMSRKKKTEFKKHAEWNKNNKRKSSEHVDRKKKSEIEKYIKENKNNSRKLLKHIKKRKKVKTEKHEEKNKNNNIKINKNKLKINSWLSENYIQHWNFWIIISHLKKNCLLKITDINQCWT